MTQTLEQQKADLIARLNEVKREKILAYAREDIAAFTISTHPSYKMGWFQREICRLLTKFVLAVEAELSPRLMIFAPPRSGKSTIVSQRLPVWFLGRNPSKSMIVASHTQRLADRLSRGARNVALAPQTQAIFPSFKLEGQSAREWQTTEGGTCISVGVDAAVHGTGADILDIDDPIRGAKAADSLIDRENTWEWFIGDAYTRLAPGAGIIVTHTRWSMDDLAGRLLSGMEEEFAEQWEVASYPAIAEKDEKHRKAGEALHPERYPLDRLLKIKNRIGSRYWSALYQQAPAPESGAFFKREDFRYFWRDDEDFVLQGGRVVKKDAIIAIYQTVDTAGTENDYSDYFACLTFAITNEYDLLFLDMFREKAETTRHHDIILQQYHKWSPFRVVVEKGGFGLSIIQHFERSGLPLVGIGADGKNKKLRAEHIRTAYEKGKVYHLQGAPWLVDFERELVDFPVGKTDDMVDVAAYSGILCNQVWAESQGRPQEEWI